MGRELIGGATNPNFILAGYQIEEIETHIQGRNAAAVEVLTGVAVLRSRSMVVNPHPTVSHRGAVYQDAQGTPLHPRAHRFPCNPTINGRNLPDFAYAHSRPHLAEALKRPLAVTDLLVLEANYADGLFESSGACEAVEQAITAVLQNQPIGQPVRVEAIADALHHVLLPGFAAAYLAALEKAHSKPNPNVPDFNLSTLLQPGGLDELNRRSIAMPITPNRPKTNIEGVGDILTLERNVAGRMPHGAAPAAIATLAASLAAL